MKIRALGIKFPSAYILLSCHEYLIIVMKNNEHKELYAKLKDLKVNIKFLVRHSLSYKEEIGNMERTEKRLELIRERQIYKKEIVKTNQEIRDTKLKIRECQRGFGR